ncbi:hypothetical protein AAHA92_12422 [Salvia divinorum]|uniref:Uncharacterized protein n=1 Tax=Salvia divinorum TaxID=28513 RepID=A0ABD1HL17_SALDI
MIQLHLQRDPLHHLLISSPKPIHDLNLDVALKGPLILVILFKDHVRGFNFYFYPAVIELEQRKFRWSI